MQATSSVTEIHGIGSKSAERLRDHGITTPRQLARRYLLDDAIWLEDALNGVGDRTLGEIVVAGRTIPPHDLPDGVEASPSAVAQGMGLVRLTGAREAILHDDFRYTGVRPQSAEIPASAVQWEEGLVTDRFGTIACVHDWAAAAGTVRASDELLDAEPVAVAEDGDGIAFEGPDGARSLLGREPLERVETLAGGIDYRERTDLVRMRTREDDHAVAFEVPDVDSCEYVIAPRIPE